MRLTEDGVKWLEAEVKVKVVEREEGRRWMGEL